MISSVRLLSISTFLLSLCAGTAVSFTSFQGRGDGSPDESRNGLTVRGTVQNFVTVTDATLRSPGPSDWLMLRRDYSATSYSPLDQITVDNVKTMKLAWSWPMREGGTNQPAPLVYK